MALYGANLELIQIYLEGKTKDDIVRLQYLNNQLNGTKYNYTSPLQQNNGSWVVWFFADIKEWNNPKELSDDEIKMMRQFGE